MSVNFAKYDFHDNELYYDEQIYMMKKNFDEAFVDFVKFEITCKNCHEIFKFNNKLHKHFQNIQCFKKRFRKNATELRTSFSDTFVEMIEFTIFTKNLKCDIDFRNWNFLETLIKLFIADFETHVCLNTDCECILKDKTFIKTKFLNIQIHIMTIFLRIRDIESTIHETAKYVRISVYFSDKRDDKQIMTCITRKIHLIDELKANILIDNDFLKLENFIINIKNRTAMISSCKIEIDLSIKQKELYVRRNVHVNHRIVVQSKLQISIFAEFSVSNDRDFVFESSNEANLILFHHIVNFTINQIVIRNNSSKAVVISKNFCFETISKLIYENFFQIQTFNLIMKSSKEFKNWIKQTNQMSIMCNAISSVASSTKKIQTLQESSLKTTLFNEIMLYDDKKIVQAYVEFIEKIFTLWRDEDFIDIAEKQWMKISLRQDWQTQILRKAKIYFMSIQDKKILNETFDDLHRKERLKWITSFISFFYSVFIAWRTVNEIRKNRAVIDIRELNKLILFDVYLLSLQFEIISDLIDCTHISILDVVTFFYQWKTHSKDIYKQIVITHKEQETFLVSVIKNRNSMSYVQRQMNTILRDFRTFVKVYIDDVVIKSRFLKDHLKHLRIIFQLFVKLNIVIKSIKIFLKYSSVSLLKQRVNVLNLFTTEKRLKIIFSIIFSKILMNLKHYLKLTEYIRNQIHYYSTIIKSLQNLKTILLKNSSTFELKRRNFTSKIIINSITQEFKSFELLQKFLSKSAMLFHFDSIKVLWMNLNTFKKFDIKIIIFHLKNNVIIKKDKWFSRTSMLSIMFLNRQLTSAKRNYWFIELEICELVWIIKKIRHLIQRSKHRIIIQIDH